MRLGNSFSLLDTYSGVRLFKALLRDALLYIRPAKLTEHVCWRCPEVCFEDYSFRSFLQLISCDYRKVARVYVRTPVQRYCERLWRMVNGWNSNIVPKLGLDVGGNFNIHIWACFGDFIVRNRWTGNFALIHTTQLGMEYNGILKHAYLSSSVEKS